MWRIVTVFVLGYVALQSAWIGARGTTLERWLIEDANVRTSVALIRVLSPQVEAVARGASVVAPGGGLNIRNGCEGTEILFPLIVALLAYPFSWRVRVFGLIAGTLFVFVLNQARLLVLFYSFRSNPQWFGELHGFVTPLLLMVCVMAFFAALLQWDRRRCA
jgi:exosortase family protein XrtM